MKRWLMVIGLCCLPASAWALTNVPTFAVTPKGVEVQVVNGTGVVTLTATTNFVTVATGGASGSRINALYCTSNDTVSHNIAVAKVRSATLYPLAVVPIAAASATSVTQVNVMTSANLSGPPNDSDRNPFIQLDNGITLVVGVLTTAVTASDAVSCFANQADF